MRAPPSSVAMRDDSYPESLPSNRRLKAPKFDAHPKAF